MLLGNRKLLESASIGLNGAEQMLVELEHAGNTAMLLSVVSNAALLRRFKAGTA